MKLKPKAQKQFKLKAVEVNIANYQANKNVAPI